MTDVWLFVFAAPLLTVVLVDGWRHRRRMRRAVDFDGSQRRAAERFPRSVP